MIRLTKLELFAYGSDGRLRLDLSKDCNTGKVFVSWSYYEADIYCAEVTLSTPNGDSWYFTGNYYKRAKFYFENGYVWDTEIKPNNEWRKMLYEELKKYIDSGYEILPGDNRSEMAMAAQLLDDEMQYEI